MNSDAKSKKKIEEQNLKNNMVNQSHIFTESPRGRYIDNGRSILRFLLRAKRICFETFMHRSNNNVTHNKTNASRTCLKYREIPEKTRNAKMTSSQMTKITISTLEVKLEVEEKKEAEAQSCLDRTWYSLSCSAKLCRVIISLSISLSLLVLLLLKDESKRRESEK